MKLLRSLIATLILFAVLAPAALTADETTDKVDHLFAAWDKTTTPGAALAVIKDGRIVYERGYGMAKLEDGIPNTPDKVFDIGSVSKQFTAACAAMLVLEGRIGLDDDIRKHIPEMPAYERPVTVRHLLHHTSGLRDYNALLRLAGFRAESDAPTVEEALEIVCRQKKLNSPPGDEHSYTNTGYFLLSQIVERVSGRTLNAFAQERIFKPLGMTRTFFQDDHRQVVRDRATGYEKTDDGYALSMSNWDMTGDGNVYTTARDLALWDQAFYTNALGKDLMDLLHTRGTLTSGGTIDYAFGLVVTTYRGLKVVEHGGAWVGFRAAIVRFPEQRFSVVILANLDAINPSRLAFGVADIYLAGLLEEPKKAEPKPVKKKARPFAVAKADLEALAGNWLDPRFGLRVVLSVKEGGLVATARGDDFAFVPVAPGRFAVPDDPSDIRLELEASGQGGAPARARLLVGTRQEFRLEKEPPVAPMTGRELEQYAGTFASEELLGARYTLSVAKDELRLETRIMAPAPLAHTGPDKFALEEHGLSIEFTRDGGGKVEGFRISAGRAAGIAFEKKGA